MRTSFLCAALVLANSAHALGRLADVSVVDRDSGETLPVYYGKGEYWVAGRPGAHYAIALRNCSGGRVLAVMSVDGVNVLSGESAGWQQNGYVFAPHEYDQIKGWRKSGSEVADFVFDTESNSYAARTGRAGNVGVIGVALFREQMAYRVPPDAVARDAPTAAPPMVRGGVASELAPSAPAPAGTADRSRALEERLGTAHGEREYDYVGFTSFERASPQPDEVIRIHYERLERLVALGIVHRGERAWPNPFPDAPRPSFVPDPP